MVVVELEAGAHRGRGEAVPYARYGETPRAVLAQFFATVRPMHETHVEPQRQHADLVLVSSAHADPSQTEADVARIMEALS